MPYLTMIKKDRWKNRRRMAWLSMIAGLLYPLLTLWTESEQLGAIASQFYLFVTLNIGYYFGFSSWDHIKTREAISKSSQDTSNEIYESEEDLDVRN